MVFTRDDGSPLRLKYINEKHDIMNKKHNLHRITIHGLRHTHASLLFEAGASIKEVQERLRRTTQAFNNEHLYTRYRLLKRADSGEIPRYIEL